MKHWTYLIAIASIVLLTSCGVSTSNDPSNDDGFTGDGSLNVPWEEPDVTDIAIDPTEVVDTNDAITPEPEPDPVDTEASYDPLSITPAGPDLDAGTVGLDYGTLKIRAHGGSGGYLMSVQGDIPPGLVAKCGAHECDGAEDVETVKLRGTPTQAGTFEFTITIEDMEDEGTSLTQTFILAVEEEQETDPSTSSGGLKIPKINMHLGLADPDEEPVVDLSNLIAKSKDAGTLRASVSIDLLIRGGTRAFVWNEPELNGEATLVIDAQDSARATLTITKIFPQLEDASRDPIVPITISATDAEGRTDSIVIDLRIAYPMPTMKDFEVVGRTKSGAWEQAAVDLTFYDRDEEAMAFWQTVGHPVDGRDPPGKLELEEGTVFDTSLQAIQAIRLDRCRSQLDPTIRSYGPDTPCKYGGVMSVNYTTIKLRSAYWEATYDHDFFLDKGYKVLIGDIIPDMEGAVSGEPSSIWHRRADAIPSIAGAAGATVGAAVSEAVGDFID